MAQTTVIFVGKKPKFLNLIKVDSAEDIKRFPEDVQRAIEIIGGKVKVDSKEFDGGELIPFGSFIAWEKAKPEDKERCPNGFNLWCKGNAREQLANGVLEEVDGRFRLTKIVPLKAQLFTGEIPEIFAEAPTFDGQVRVEDKKLFIQTPWGVSDCKAGEGFAIEYGRCTEDSTPVEKFWGKLDGNVLSVDTEAFEDYFRVTESGEIIETLREYYESL